MWHGRVDKYSFSYLGHCRFVIDGLGCWRGGKLYEAIVPTTWRHDVSLGVNREMSFPQHKPTQISHQSVNSPVDLNFSDILKWGPVTMCSSNEIFCKQRIRQTTFIKLIDSKSLWNDASFSAFSKKHLSIALTKFKRGGLTACLASIQINCCDKQNKCVHASLFRCSTCMHFQCRHHFDNEALSTPRLNLHKNTSIWKVLVPAFPEAISTSKRMKVFGWCFACGLRTMLN